METITVNIPDTEETIVIPISDCKLLASGGSKNAVQITEKYMIMLPGFVHPERPDIKRLFRRGNSGSQCYPEELHFSRLFEQVGLLTTEQRPCTCFLNDSEAEPERSKIEISTFVATSFDYMAKQGRYVIDRKNNESTTWKGHIFPVDADLSEPEQWKPVLKEYIKDILQRCLRGFTGSGDSLSMLIIQDGERYYMRAINFDFEGCGDTTYNFSPRSKICEENVHLAITCGIQMILYGELEARSEILNGKRKIIFVLPKNYGEIADQLSDAMLPYAEELVKEISDVTYYTLREQKRDKELMEQRDREFKERWEKSKLETAETLRRIDEMNKEHDRMMAEHEKTMAAIEAEREEIRARAEKTAADYHRPENTVVLDNDDNKNRGLLSRVINWWYDK